MSDFDANDPLQAEVMGFAGVDARILCTFGDNEEPDGGFRQFIAITADDERCYLNVVRGWTSSNRVPSVSVDLSVPFEALVGEHEPDLFPHGGASRIEWQRRMEKAFEAEVGGDVVFLWKHHAETGGAFLARVARVGCEEELVIGRVSGPDLSVEIDHRSILDRLSAAPVQRY